MTWRMAKSLETLREQLNAMSPNRSKASDGGIGNAEHASRSSDHNPWVRDGAVGVVTARDFTHDPVHGVDSQKLAEMLVASNDQRIKYIISNRRICSIEKINGEPPWTWRRYNGKNPHDHHVHVSVKSDKAHYDDTSPWQISLNTAALNTKPAEPERPTLRQYTSGDHVKALQVLLNKHGAVLIEDGDFGKVTASAVRIFQKMHGLVADGVVGPYTWDALNG